MLLGDKVYLFGSAPYEADACMFALLDHVLITCTLRMVT